MKPLLNLFLIISLAWIFSCTSKTPDPEVVTIEIQEDEVWWGGAVMHGRMMPFGRDNYTLKQYGNTVSNQSQPMFISNKGRYIWSDGPLDIEFRDRMIRVSAEGADVVAGQHGETLRQAYNFVSQNFFPPTGKMPDPVLFTHPQYNTWIELQYNQNEAGILEYAEGLIRNGFPPGVLMIDDTWQSDYGVWEFAAERFSAPGSMIEKLHALGYKVMLWICPFISADSPPYRYLAYENLLLFEDREKTSPAVVQWWNGKSALIDLTNQKGREWYTGQMKRLMRKYGVDGFKLDAGDAVFYQNTYAHEEISPNEHTKLHAEIGLEFPLNEYRACWKMAGQPLAQRLQDKGHDWNDLQALIPDMLAQGLLGYAFGCPDMIGGGSFTSFLDDAVLDQELIIRSAQCHVLMPMMQFSVAPWRVLNKENLSICKTMADLRLQMGEEILEIARKSALTGEPVVRHMEYVFPGKGYWNIKDQFMLGDNILVAPVLEKNKNFRKVSFPEGTWQGDDGSVVDGPDIIEINAPLERLPWYRQIDK